MTPWVMLSPSQFHPAGPPALGSARYAADLAETQSIGSFSSATRTADQTLAARFWAVSTAGAYWNRIAVNLGVDAKKSDQTVRGSVVLPAGIGKKVRVAV